MIKKILKFGAGSFLILVLGVAGILGYEYYEDRYWQKQEDLVLVSVQYSEGGGCENERPLKVSASNTSEYSVNKIEWDLGLYNPGYSTDLISSGYHEFSHDKILQNGASWDYCIAMPKTDGAIHVKSFEETKDMSQVLKRLEYTIQNKNVIFDKNA